MKTKLEYMHVLTDLPTQDLQEMFDDELLEPEEIMAGTYKVRTYKEWEELLNGDLGKAIGIVENQQEMPYEFAKILTDNFWELVGD